MADNTNISFPLNYHRQIHFINTVRYLPGTFSCAIDCFLEVAAAVFQSHLCGIERTSVVDLIYNMCSNYKLMIASAGQYELQVILNFLQTIREHVWAYFRATCPSFASMSANAQFSEIFQLKNFQFSETEKQLFVSSFNYDGFCVNCNIPINSKVEIFLNYVSFSDLCSHNFETDCWPNLICHRNIENTSLQCSSCMTVSNMPINLSLTPSRILLIEFASDAINKLSFFDNINALQHSYQLKGLVRCLNLHFSCAVFENGSWLLIDDLCDTTISFDTVSQLLSHYPHGWFFGVYTMVNHDDTNHLNQTNVTAFKVDSNEQFPVGNTKTQFIDSSTESDNSNKKTKVDKELFSELKEKIDSSLKSKVTVDFKAKRSYWNRKAYKERLNESAKQEKLFCHVTRNGNMANAHGTTNSKTNCKIDAMGNDLLADSKDAHTASEGQESKYFLHQSHGTSAKNCNSNWQTPLHEQALANQNMDKFHQSMQLTIIQCVICKEAWPKRNVIPEGNEDYMCTRCKRDKYTPKKFSAANNMIPCAVPPELQNLTQFEEMLIARAFPVIHVYTKPKGGQRAYKGHVITFPQEVQQLADILPRCPKDLPVLIFTVNGKDNKSKDFTVRKQKVSDALHWLVENNPLYQTVRIDYNQLENLPDNGQLECIRKVNISNTDDHQCEQPNIDRGPVDTNKEDIVYDENSEMSSFLPVNIDTKKQTELLKDEVSQSRTDNRNTFPWTIGDNPLSEYDTEYLATMSFPTLFPDGKGDPTNSATLRSIADNDTEAFAQKIKHLIKFAEHIDGKWTYRFASHPRFGYWAYNILYRHRILGQGNFYLKQNPGDANLNIDDLRQIVDSGSFPTIMSKLMVYAKNVSGTNAYWNHVKDDLKTTINQVGTPTIFWTLSCADFHWPEFHSLFNSDSEDSQTLRSNVINNPHLLDWLFTERTESFVRLWLYKTLNAAWHWYRFEYAVQRGSIHVHGLAKLKDDPGLCELTKLALKGHLATEAKQKLQLNELTAQQLDEMENDIEEGYKAERIVCQYVDYLMTTTNPCDPEEWVKPSQHPCKRHYFEISQDEWDKDYEDLLNSVQRHTLCNSAYCMKQKDDGSQKCRFDYPFALTEQTHIEFEKVHTKDGAERYRAKVVTARNDPRMNRHQRLQLQGWRANCDINIIIDYHSCVEYLTKYASKAEKLSSVARDAFVSVVTNHNTQNDTRKIVKKLMMKAVGQRDMSVQEVMHQLLSLKLFSSSFQVVTACLEGSRKFNIKNNEIKTEPSILDIYAGRDCFRTDFPDIMTCNFVKFVATFYFRDDKIKRRKNEVVVKTFPSYNSNPKSSNYGLFCKFQLLKYKPWSVEPSNAWNNEEPSDETFSSYWQTFLETSEGQMLVPNWTRELENIQMYIDDLPRTDDDFEEPSCGEREEWMFLAELKSKDDGTVNNNSEQSCTDYWQHDRKLYTDEQIGNMPTWIEDQKKNQPVNQNPLTSVIDVASFNKAQNVAYTIVFDHFLAEQKDQLLLIITGLAGCGKSYIINALKNLLQDSCKVCAYFGVAAFNVKGTTLHSLLQLPIKGKKSAELKANALCKLQEQLNGVEYLIIDEYSVIGQKMFGWISRRCKQATGKTTLSFGGLSIIVVGDIAQLPPISDKVIYHNKPSGQLATEGFCAYHKFDRVVKLNVNERAHGSTPEQEDFRNLQINIRNGNTTVDEWKLLLTRTPSNVPNLKEFEKKAVKLSYGNEKVAEHNYENLTNLGQPIAKIKAKHNNATSAKLPTDDMGCLEPELLLAKGAKVC